MIVDNSFEVAGTSYKTRLIIGTGKYVSFEQMRACIEAAQVDLLTVAVRRVNLGQDKNSPQINEFIPEHVKILPNTAGCEDAVSAIRTAQLARELVGTNRIKLEVLAAELYPNMPETLVAAEKLVKLGFEVWVYCSDDPIQCKMLEDIGCVAIMPLGSVIGSGLGILNPQRIEKIRQFIKVPLIVDAGVGTASDASLAMEIGCDAVLMNTAIAKAREPVLMASAMYNAVLAGRCAYLAGRMPKFATGSASSPSTGIVN